MKKYIILFLLAIIPNLSFAQIEISIEESLAYYSVGRSYNFNVDYDHTMWDIGNPGGDNIWDFSAAESAKQTLFSPTLINAAGTPFEAFYPTASIVEYSDIDSVLDEKTTANYKRYTYHSKTSSGLYDELGVGEIITTNNIDNGEFVYERLESYTHLTEEFQFPLQFDKGWTFTDTFTVITKWGDEPYSDPFIQHIFEDTLHVDAWGTIKLPNGKLTSALRVRHFSKGTSPSIIPGFPPTLSETTYYRFYTKSDGYLFVSADDDNAAHSGVVEGTISWIDENITNVEKLESIPTEFALKQNYPNPFNPSTKIEYSIGSPNHVKLKVFDIIGNEIAELVSESQKAGNYRYSFDGSGLSSGTYFVQLNAGEYREVRKISLVK